MAAVDTFTGRNTNGPYTGGEAVTPHDTTTLTKVSRAIYVGVAGNVTCLMRDGQTLTFTALAVGWHPLRVQRVNATLTTATTMIAVW